MEKIQREKAEKEKAEDEKAQRERLEEQARNDEAKQAAAAGKEEIGADTKKVELPGSLPSRPASASASSSSTSSAAAAGAAAGTVSPGPTPAQPLDPQIAKAQAELERLSLEAARDLAARNRYAEKATFRYASSEDSKDVDPPVASMVEYVGAFAIAPDPAKAGAPVSVVLSDVSKRSSQAGQATVKADVEGSFTLTVSADGKTVSGTIEHEDIAFERFDAASDPDKSLQFLLGY